MLPLADLHCHLLPGLDDGPRTWDDALAMCRLAVEEGTRYSVALAHQSERWPVTSAAIRAASGELAARLAHAGIPLTVYPAAEVMAAPDLEVAWDGGRLLSVGDAGKYVLIEMPNGLFVDLRSAVRRFAARQVRVILAHPERHPELLHDPSRLRELIGLGCLVQVSASSVTKSQTAADGKALRAWFKSGHVHLLGSDGHSPRTRKPLLAAAAYQVRSWVGGPAADAIVSHNGRAVLRGEILTPPKPKRVRSWWPLTLGG